MPHAPDNAAGSHLGSVVRTPAMLPHLAAATGIAVLVWLQVAVHGAAGVSVALPRACPSRAGPGTMVVVAAPTPYYSWEACEYTRCR
jgi:hypothetical protein